MGTSAFSRYRYSGFSKATILHENKKSCNRANRAIVNVPSIPLLAYDKWKLGINIILSSVTNHPCPFFDVQFCLSSADWCTAGPLLTDVLYSTAGPVVLCWLMYCWSSAEWCTAGPLLADVLLILGCLMYRWASAAYCPALPVCYWLMQCVVFVLKWPGILELSVIHRKFSKMFT